MRTGLLAAAVTATTAAALLVACGAPDGSGTALVTPLAAPAASATAAPDPGTLAPGTPAPGTPAPGSTPTPGSAACPDPGWSCVQQQRFAAAAAHARRAAGPNGHVAAVFVDRVTGATWRTGDTARPGWTASTIKLAIATDLLARDRAGTVHLSAGDRHDMATMLNFSDEAASDRLWRSYGGDAMLDRFRERFGMRALRFVPGFTRTTYWGFVRCSTDDLAALAQYVLTRTDPADRAYLVAAMRGVAPNQRWGVWAAGTAQRPGNKDGWSFESDPGGRHWVADTVGFAGPGERYAVAVMDQADPGADLAGSVHAVSDLVALLFGLPVPAPITVPAPDG